MENKPMAPLITVFTPAYNRAHLLPRLFESLQRQTLRDFEWLVVDDGSTDDTAEVVNTLASGADFPVRYVRKENGGKHTAVNLGVKLAKGELFFILDSDDELPADSLEIISEKYAAVRGRGDICGVCGYMAHRDGAVIGCPRIDGVEASSVEMRYKYGVVGDMAEVFRTSVLRKFPFPEIAGEKFCPEALVWNRIARKHKLYVFSNVIYLRDYLDGGLTDNIVRIRMHSPVASMMTYAELAEYPAMPLRVKARAAINYWRFRLCLGRVVSGFPRLGLRWAWAAPLGAAMHLRDRRKTKC